MADSANPDASAWRIDWSSLSSTGIGLRPFPRTCCTPGVIKSAPTIQKVKSAEQITSGKSGCSSSFRRSDQRRTLL